MRVSHVRRLAAPRKSRSTSECSGCNFPVRRPLLRGPPPARFARYGTGAYHGAGSACRTRRRRPARARVRAARCRESFPHVQSLVATLRSCAQGPRLGNNCRADDRAPPPLPAATILGGAAYQTRQHAAAGIQSPAAHVTARAGIAGNLSTARHGSNPSNTE